MGNFSIAQALAWRGADTTMGRYFLLKNAAILDVVAGDVMSERDILIEDGRIREIGDPGLTARDAEVLELGGRMVLPGLCDAHIHVAVCVNSFVEFTRLSPSYVALRAAPALRGMLMRGFTTVRDAGGADFGFARAANEGLIESPRILYCGKALSQTGGHGDLRMGGENAFDSHYYVPGLGRVCDGVEQVRAAARDEIRRGAHHVKIMAGGGVASYTDPIDNDQFSVDEIRAVVEEAEMANLYVMAHTYTARQIARSAENGVRSLEHCNFIDDATAALAARLGAFVVPTLSIFEVMFKHGLEAGVPAEIHNKTARVRAAGPGSLEILARHDVKMAFGTDLMGSFHDQQGLEFKLRAEVLAPLEIIRSATCYAAELFRMEGEIGVIAPGARADLIAVRGNPLDDIGLLSGQGERLDLIMKDGVIHKNTLA